MRFSNKSAIVTGAGRGIGYEICRQLVREGATVILNDIEPDLAENAAARIVAETKGNCVPLTGDSASIDCIHQMTDLALAKGGHLDIVIANAGITLFGNFFDYKPADFERVMQVNLLGSFFLAQAASKQMKKQGYGGSILFTSSVTAHQAHRDLAAYGMSKAALEMLARNLVVELSPFKINVNAIAPGATLTERTQEDPEYRKVWSGLIPMGMPAQVSEIAHAALFLVQEESRHITGQTLIIDGGWSSISPPPY